MSNFLSSQMHWQMEKTAEEVRAEGVDEDLIVHRTAFEDNHPSLSIIAPKLTAYSNGQL
jgi:glucose-6-phosphate isomerase